MIHVGGEGGPLLKQKINESFCHAAHSNPKILCMLDILDTELEYSALYIIIIITHLYENIQLRLQLF